MQKNLGWISPQANPILFGYKNYHENYGEMAIGAIDAIADLGNPYGCIKKSLDLRIATSDFI